MFNQKIYEPSDKMISIISDNYSLLESLGRFGINLGFGDKTVREVCEEQGVDSYTFLAIVNYSVNGYRPTEGLERISVETILHYLKASHEYYLDFQLPRIRKNLKEALDENDNLARLIMKMYDRYAHEIRQHMKFEEQTVFPYVEKLLKGEVSEDYDIQTFSKHHGQTTQKLHELKDIIIKYLPSNTERNNRLTYTLYDLYKNEEWLGAHAEIEDNIFIPAIQRLERQLSQNDVSVKISQMISKSPEGSDTLSDREKDVIVALVQGMSNKEIADHLCISTNTVITHRRNIARKLQIHSPAGLTIYAIVNNLVEISSVKF